MYNVHCIWWALTTRTRGILMKRKQFHNIFFIINHSLFCCCCSSRQYFSSSNLLLYNICYDDNSTSWSKSNEHGNIYRSLKMETNIWHFYDCFLLNILNFGIHEFNTIFQFSMLHVSMRTMRTCVYQIAERASSFFFESFEWQIEILPDFSFSFFIQFSTLINQCSP